MISWLTNHTPDWSPCQTTKMSEPSLNLWLFFVTRCCDGGQRDPESDHAHQPLIPPSSSQKLVCPVFCFFFFFISFYIYNFYLILTSLYMFFFNGVVTKLVACASNDRIAVTLINLVLVAAALLLVFAGAASPVEENWRLAPTPV